VTINLDAVLIVHHLPFIVLGGYCSLKQSQD